MACGEIDHSAVREFRDTKNKRAWLAGVQTTLGGLPGIGGLAGALGEIGATAAVTGYSRDLERQADVEGFRRVVKAGYDPAETPKLFLVLERDAKQEKVASASLFYATHPRLQERRETVEEMIRTEFRERHGGLTNVAVFRRKTSQVVLDNAWMDLKAGRFDAARQGAEKYVAFRPADARGHYLLGEVKRQTGERSVAEQAIAHYRQAIALRPDFQEALSNLAWLLATRPEAELRDGAQAVELAERACELTAYKLAACIGTLAAAYAEAGRFADAAAMAEHAHSLAEAANQKELAAKSLKLQPNAVQPVDQAAQQVACPSGQACTANVIVTVGADLQNTQ